MSGAQHFPAWVAQAIFYQIFPDRFHNGDPANDPPNVRPWGELPTRESFFGGDLRGILLKLDYLQDLEVNALYLNPIFLARSNHKYDTADYFQVDPGFGSNQLLKELVAECHRRDMRVVLDGVFNHCGLEFFAFDDLRTRGEASAYRDWFTVLSYPLTPEPLSYLVCGDAHYLPKLNTRHRPVQEYILKVARYWLEEVSIDGWRLDVPFKLPIEFWHEFRQQVKSVNPQAYLVGEVWREAQPWIEAGPFDGVTNYRWRELILDYCATHLLDAEDFAFEMALLNQAHGLAAPAMLNLLGSHDTPRILSQLGGDVARLRIALTLLLTAPGAPLLYYGDEVGLMGQGDPDCRRTMPWDGTGRNEQIFEFVRQLIALRKAHPALRGGPAETLLAFNGLAAFRQSCEDDEAIIVVNPRGGVHNISIPTHSHQEQWRDCIEGQCFTASNGILHQSYVPAHAAWILLPHSQ